MSLSKSEPVSAAADWTELAHIDEIEIGGVLATVLGETHLAICRLSSDEVRIIGNICTHAFAYLSDGWLEDGEIECPLHAGKFDVRTGRALCAPLTENLVVYPVSVTDGVISVQLDGGAAQSA